MAKRFIDTDIWEQDWFSEMPSKYKLFWQFITTKCDHAGIWRPNKKFFQAMTDEKIDLDTALKYFNSEKERVLVLDNGRWLIIAFISFQYGSTLNTANKVHKSIYQLLNTNEVKMTSLRPLVEVKEGVKDKDKEKDKDNTKVIKSKKGSKQLLLDDVPGEEIILTKDNIDAFIKKGNHTDKELVLIFDYFRINYPHTKKGLETELKNFKAKHKEWKSITLKLVGALRRELSYKTALKKAGEFVPEWKNLSTWINNSCWEDEFPEITTQQLSEKKNGVDFIIEM